MNLKPTEAESCIDLVFVTTVEHLYTLSLSLKSLVGFHHFRKVHIVTSARNFIYFRHLESNCGKANLNLIDENTVLPKMTLPELAGLDTPCFPGRAGWYFQQFLKLGVSALDVVSENYLVVDADTIFLKKIPLLENDVRYCFNKSVEHHAPYFENYLHFMKEQANREFSFISQYMLFNKRMVREMLSKMERNFNNADAWHWLIAKNLKGDGASLFSEYETYGHYMKNHHPEVCSYLDLPWQRVELNSLMTYVSQKSLIRNTSFDCHYISLEQRANSYSAKIAKRLCKVLVPYLFLIKSHLK